MTGETRLPAPMDTLRGHGLVLVQAEGHAPDTLRVNVSGLLHDVAFATVAADSVAIDGEARGVIANPMGHVAVHVRKFAEKTQGPLLAALDAHVTASRSALDARVTANADPARVKGVAIAPVAITAHVPLAPGDGMPAIAQNSAIAASVRWQDFPLTLANAFIGQPLFDTGTGDIDLQVSGTLRAPTVDAKVSLAKAGVYGVSDVAAKLAVKTDAKTSAVTLTAQLAGASVLDFNASMQAGLRQLAQPETLADAPLTIHLTVPDTPLDKLGSLVPETLGGKLAVRAEVSGTAWAPRGAIDVAWTQAQVAGYRLGTVSAGALMTMAPAEANKAAATRVTVSAEIEGRRLLDAMATVPGTTRRWLREKILPAIEMSAHVPDFDLAALASGDLSVAHSSGKLRGEFTGQWVGSDMRGDGTLDLIDGALSGQAIGTMSVTAHYAPGSEADAHFSLVQPKGGAIKAEAALHEGALDANLNAQKFDLAFLANGLRQLRAVSGTLEANVAAAGKLDALAMNGTLGLKNGVFGMSQVPTLKGIDVDVALKTNHIDVKINQVKSGKGTLTGTASANLEGVRPIYVGADLKTKDFQLGIDGVADATLDSTLAAHITLAKAITGDVKMSDAVLHVPKIDPGSAPRSAARPSDIIYVDRPKELAKLHGEAVGTPIDINVEVAPLFVRGKQIDAEVASQLEVKVDAAGKFAPHGAINIRSGYITLFDRRYDIIEGRVGLDGSTEINPTIKLRMQHQFTEANVTLGLQGTASAPELVLLSDPAIYDRAQIISLVINGQISSSDSRSPDAKNTLTNAVLGAALGSLADTIAPKIGLDVLKIGIGAPNTDMSNPAAVAAANQSDPNATQARVEVGKYIAHRLYVSYDRVFGAQEGQNSNEAKLEYRMTPRLTLQSLFGDAGVGGLDMQWTYRY
jgi:translocation and assembly module TamB